MASLPRRAAAVGRRTARVVHLLKEQAIFDHQSNEPQALWQRNVHLALSNADRPPDVLVHGKIVLIVPRTHGRRHILPVVVRCDFGRRLPAVVQMVEWRAEEHEPRRQHGVRDLGYLHLRTQGLQTAHKPWSLRASLATQRVGVYIYIFLLWRFPLT